MSYRNVVSWINWIQASFPTKIKLETSFYYDKYNSGLNMLLNANKTIVSNIKIVCAINTHIYQIAS